MFVVLFKKIHESKITISPLRYKKRLRSKEKFYNQKKASSVLFNYIYILYLVGFTYFNKIRTIEIVEKSVHRKEPISVFIRKHIKI